MKRADAFAPVSRASARRAAEPIAEIEQEQDADRATRAKRVALVVESAVAPRRMMLTGVARYIQEHQPWAVYLKPFGVEKSLPSWLQHWRGDGVIAAVKDPASDVIVRSGIPVVDVVGVLRHEQVPLVHTNDCSVGRLGAEHLLERGFRHFAFCEYAGEFWSVDRRIGFQQALRDKGLDCAMYDLMVPGPGSGGPQSWEAQQHNLAAWLKS